MFDVGTIEEWSDDGQLTAIGVEWSECREHLRKFVFGCMMVSIIAGTITTFLISAFVQQRWLSVVIGLVMMTPIVFFDRLSLLPGRPRVLIFYRDGAIEAPLGFSAYAARYRHVSGSIAGISTMEAMQTASRLEAGETPYNHGVVLTKFDGDLVHVAGHLLPNHAHKLAVQLTLALARLREDMATHAMGESAVQPDHQGYAAAQFEVID